MGRGFGPLFSSRGALCAVSGAAIPLGWPPGLKMCIRDSFVAGCEDYGVRFTDRRGREYLSTAHTQEDIRRTLAVADQVLGEMEQEGI